MITQSRLKELFTYNPETGIFTRNISVKGQKVENKVGATTAKGYISIKADRTRSENFRNTGARKNSKTGIKGVSKTKTGYLVMFCVGTYKTLEEAKEAYAKMAVLYHGEFIHKSVVS